MTGSPPPPGRMFALSLASIALIGPLAVHLFLPVIPAIKPAFGLTEAAAQLAFSVALFGMAFATLVYGTLADRFGRRPVLLSGLTLFLLGSVLSAVAPSAAVLVLGRLLQAVGAGCGMTLVRTIARDAYGPERLVKIIAYLTMFYTLGPMISPVVGGLLVDSLGWRSVFGFALLLGALILIGAWRAIPETRPPALAGAGSSSVVGSYVALFAHARFSAFVFQAGFSSGAFMACAAASSPLMKEFLARPATEFGLYFMLFPAGYFCGNFISSRIGSRARTEPMVLGGAIVTMSAAAVQALWLLLGEPVPLAIFLPGFFLTLGQGISLPYGQAASMAVVPGLAGTAAGIGTFLQFFLGAVFAQLYGLLADGTPGPMIATTAGASLLGLAMAIVPLLLARRDRPG